MYRSNDTAGCRLGTMALPALLETSAQRDPISFLCRDLTRFCPLIRYDSLRMDHRLRSTIRREFLQR